MKLIDGDRLKNHLDYLIKKDNQFAKMCDGNDDYDRQRKYCFEVDVLAYELCKSVMDYYLVKDVQDVSHNNNNNNKEMEMTDDWISIDDKLPAIDEQVLVYIRTPDDHHYNIETAHLSGNSTDGDNFLYWVFRDSSFYSTRFRYVTHWQPFPNFPINQ